MNPNQGLKKRETAASRSEVIFVLILSMEWNFLANHHM